LRPPDWRRRSIETALDVTTYKRTEKTLHELQRELRELEDRVGVADPVERED
jgi:hypothetical protein